MGECDKGIVAVSTSDMALAEMRRRERLVRSGKEAGREAAASTAGAAKLGVFETNRNGRKVSTTSDRGATVLLEEAETSSAALRRVWDMNRI